MHQNIRYPLVGLPEDTQVSLYLIKEELKSRKLFHARHEAGLDDCYFQPHLDSLILQSVGMNDDSDETFTVYQAIMERRSKKIAADDDSIMKQALKVYMELKPKRRNDLRANLRSPCPVTQLLIRKNFELFFIKEH